MQQIRTVFDVKQLGTIMGVWAHPDDETFTSAGIMAAAAINGQKVICLTATKGEQGVQDEQRWPAHKLADIRAKELEDALKIIGVQHHHWLEYKDGCCSDVDKHEAVQCICSFIDTYQPDTILTFGPDGITGHTDHQAVCLWTSDACKHASKEPKIFYAVHTKNQYEGYLKELDRELNIFFNIDEPPIIPVEQCDIYFELTKKERDIKCKALKAMPSQTEKMFSLFSKEQLEHSLTPETFVRAK